MVGGRLQLVARLIKAGLGPRVFYTVQPGYDTHAAQLNDHARLLAALSQGPSARVMRPAPLSPASAFAAAWAAAASEATFTIS